MWGQDLFEENKLSLLLPAFCCLNAPQFYLFFFIFIFFLFLFWFKSTEKEKGRATIDEEDENRSKTHNPQQFDEEDENPDLKLSRLKKNIEKDKQYGFVAGEGENPNLLS